MGLTLQSALPVPRGGRAVGNDTPSSVPSMRCSSTGNLYLRVSVVGAKASPEKGFFTGPRHTKMIKEMHAIFSPPRAAELRALMRDKLGLHASDVGEGWLIFDAPEAHLGTHPTEGKAPPSGTAD